MYYNNYSSCSPAPPSSPNYFYNDKCKEGKRGRRGIQGNDGIQGIQGIQGIINISNFYSWNNKYK